MRPSTLYRIYPILLTLLLSGCGAGPTVPLGDTEESNESTGETGLPVVFADDADEDMASLPTVENELLVQPYPGADATALADLYAEVGATVIGELSDIGLTVLQVPPDELAQIAEELASSDLIEGIHRNYRYDAQQSPSDPMFVLQHHLAQIGIAEAWNLTTGAQEIVIAIVDTGVQPDHPDLEESIVDGWNVLDGNADYADAAGHGTQVTGIVAAVSNNLIGVTGVTWDCPILAVRVADDDGWATSRNIAAGILWAIGQGAKVINVSFSPLWSNTIVRSAARQAFNRGALVVISAGNAGGLTRSRGYHEALFVGAVDERGELASFSDRGPFVDIVAPGTSIRTTSMGSSYRRTSGTSFAAPIVAGAAALAWSTNPDLRPTTIVDALIGAAVDLGPAFKDDSYGHGLVDVGAAVAAASRTTFVPDVSPPTVQIVQPEEGETLSGRSIVTVEAEDFWGVADVVMSVDGMPFATDTRPPYRFVLAADALGGGDHELSFVATDLTGNASDPAAITVYVTGSRRVGQGSLPQIVFEAPVSGSLVTEDTTIRATVSAGVSLAYVEWLIDDVPVFVTAVSGSSSLVTYMWRISSVEPGPHTITLVVTDAGGAMTTGRLELNTR
ncbi:MAG: S8 family serine peptidase [Planctomycetes bacterium]|nr:S8 family serine peptidase [Planctomycetota bacterium]